MRKFCPEQAESEKNGRKSDNRQVAEILNIPGVIWLHHAWNFLKPHMSNMSFFKVLELQNLSATVGMLQRIPIQQHRREILQYSCFSVFTELHFWWGLECTQILLLHFHPTFPIQYKAQGAPVPSCAWRFLIAHQLVAEDFWSLQFCLLFLECLYLWVSVSSFCPHYALLYWMSPWLENHNEAEASTFHIPIQMILTGNFNWDALYFLSQMPLVERQKIPCGAEHFAL